MLATLRDELGTFARECAAALTALDAFAGLAELDQALSAARTSSQHAALVLDVGRRLSGLTRPELARSTTTDESGLVELYTKLGEDQDLPPSLVRQAGALLGAEPARSDRELLLAVVNAGGVRSQIEQIVGPAPLAALSALRPLARWAPALSRLHRGEGGGRDLIESAGADLTEVLQATVVLGGGAAAGTAADATALADSLAGTVRHVEAAAKAVREGKLDQVLAEARRTLENDLDRLRAVHEDAPATAAEWRAARRSEHAALTEEVREKLEKIERTRRVLAALLPHLQTVTRALATVERLQQLERRLEPQAAAGVEAARLTLLLGLTQLWDEIVSRPPRAVRPRSRVPGRWIVAAVVVAAAVALAVALATLGSSKHTAATAPLTTTATAATTAASTSAATTTTAAPAPAAPQPKLSPVKGVFDPAQRATFYTVTVTSAGQGAPTYTWRLAPPKNDPGCNRFAPVPGSPDEAVWHHADTDGCAHIGIQHTGTVTVTVTTADWQCMQSFFGTLTHDGTAAQRCRRR